MSEIELETRRVATKLEPDSSIVDAGEVRVTEQAKSELIVSPDVTDSEHELLEEGERAGVPGAGKEKSTVSLRRELNLLDATAYVVGGIIGSGIFITPAIILEETGSFAVSMICWFVGMIIAMCGALCYIELGLLIPRTGAEYVYILHGFSFKKRNKWTELLGSLMAFLYTWTAVIIVRPSSTSIIALTFARYLSRPFYIGCEIPESVLKCISISVVILQAVIVSRSVKLMAKISNVIMFLKLLSIGFIVVVCIAGIIRAGSIPDDLRHPFRGSSISSPSDVGGLAIAMYSVLFAFDGWNGFGFAVEEMKKPERNLPRAMMIGMTIVSICYFLVNLSFFFILSNDEIVSAQAVALSFGQSVMGTAGVVIFPLLVALSTFGTNILNIYVGSRLIFSSAREGQFPTVMSGVHVKWGTPIAAIVLQTIMASIYIASGDVRSLIEGFSAALWVFFCLAFTALLIMRFTHKHDRRPFKVWWILPVVMIVVSVFLIALPLASDPGPSLIAFAIILSGAPVYVFLVMERPWKLRPAFLDTCSDFIAKHVNRLLQAEPGR